MTELIDGLYYEGEKIADTKAPHSVPIDRRWEQRKFEAKLVNPANRRKLDIIVVGSGLAGGAAAASLGEQGYNVKVFFYQDSARRAHSIAAQGGINAAKNYRNDGDSVYRLFYDTVKGGDYRAREDNVYRLAEVSANIIDQCVAQGVPFAREYGGLLDNRSFGGVQVSRTFYARGQTGQQLLIGAYQALERQVHAGTVKEFRRHEMVELIIVDGRARGIVTRDMVSGKIETHLADAVVLASGGYGNVFFLSTNAMGCNATAVWRAHRKGAYFANPCYTQIHPTCIPQSGDFQSKLTLMSESLRNDGRIWVPKKAEDCDKDPRDIPEEARDYYLERIYPAFGNLVPRDIASRQAKNMCDEGRGVGPAIKERDANGNERMMRRGVYLDFSEAINRLGKDAVSARYGNLFEMYQRITGDDPYEVPMRIYPAVHYTMGGLWVDYDLESKLTLMSESLRNDGRIWVPKKAEDCDKDPRDIPEEARDYYLERIYPAFGNLVPRDIASRQAKNMCDEGRGVGPAIKERDANGNERMMRRGVYLDFSEAINRLGKDAVSARYGNLFEMYQRITGDDPYEVPMRIYPAVHYTMGGLWVDYDLESNVPGLYIAGEANFSDHGANRLGASALMQGLADGYFVLPDTMNDYLADMLRLGKVDPNAPEIAEAKRSVEERVARLMALRGTRSVDDFHMALGRIMWEYCGMERRDAGLRDAIGQIRALKEEFWRDARITGQADELNQALEKAGRLLDFFELAELMCIDALHRRESCGGHFRAESQTPEGEALRHDDEFLYVAAWEWGGENQPPILHKEDLVYKDIELKQRSYK